MTDILLNANGDIEVGENGDITITDSICQAVKIRLKWIHEEWRLGPDLGFTWFEDVFVKDPNLETIKHLIQNEIVQVEGVESAEVTAIDYKARERKINFTCSFTVANETYTEEATINV